jgi:hypothetical protein
MISSDSHLLTPTKTFRVRRRLKQQSVSYKTIKIAKRLKRASGLPKPLSCEEDFVIELKDAPSDFLKPCSGYYELPEIMASRAPTAYNGINPRDIVGSMESFQKHWNVSNESRVRDLIKKNKSILAFTGQTLNSFDNIFRRKESLPVTTPAQVKSKAQDLHQQRKMYWERIDKNLQRQATVKTRIKRKITSIMNTPI